MVLGETPSSFGDLPSGRISDKKAELELRKEAALGELTAEQSVERRVYL